jgi:hypothetical protein
MDLKRDDKRFKLYDGLRKHFPDIPREIVLRTVELASTPVVAFDALYEFKLKLLPTTWDFEKQRWVKHKLMVI